MNTNINFQLGLLNFVHLLVYADGYLDVREKEAILSIKEEEGILDEVFEDFEQSVILKKEQEIYNNGIIYLNRCTEEEKLCVLVHLFRLAQADSSIHVKEIRLLFYAMQITQIEFDDVVMTANLAVVRM